MSYFSKYHKNIMYCVTMLLIVVMAFLLFQNKGNTSKIKVACVGDSITYGTYLNNPQLESYPAQLQSILGNTYEVVNFGVSGATIANNNTMSYMKQNAFQESLKYEPDIILIMLGTNDSMDNIWEDEESFDYDISVLVDAYEALGKRVYLLTPSSSFILEGNDDLVRGMHQKRISHIVNVIINFANEKKLPYINIAELTEDVPQYYLLDGVHPNVDGAKYIAQYIAKRIQEDEFHMV